MLACTVCPTSTRRSTTTPSIGDLIVQYCDVQLGLRELRLRLDELLLGRRDRCAWRVLTVELRLLERLLADEALVEQLLRARV